MLKIRSTCPPSPFPGVADREFGRYEAEVEEGEAGVEVRLFEIKNCGLLRKPLGTSTFEEHPLHVILDKVTAIVQQAEHDHRYLVSGKYGARFV
jgi:hypothetical protein